MKRKKLTRDQKVQIKNQRTLQKQRERERFQKQKEAERIAAGNAFREQIRKEEARERRYIFLEEENERLKVKILNLQLEVDQLRRELLLKD